MRPQYLRIFRAQELFARRGELSVIQLKLANRANARPRSPHSVSFSRRTPGSHHGAQRTEEVDKILGGFGGE